jgi:hypothetical protein
MTRKTEGSRKKTVEPEFIEEPAEKKDWRPRINYEGIVRNIPFTLFLSLLALVYIANGHYAVKNIREINRLDKEVKELHWHYLDAKTDLMLRSKMSEVYRGVAPGGLDIPVNPPLGVPAGKDE